jgi:DMSO/TMAO reductase YedYZ molybdopterin-dependent catalytic subunit
MIMARKDQDSRNTSTTNGLGRRLFLKMSAMLPLILAIPRSLWAIALKAFPVRTVEKDSFTFDPRTGLLYWKEKKRSEPYELVIDGLVSKSTRLSYSDLRTLPQTQQVSDFHCVEGWTVDDVPWGGVRFEEILKRVTLKPEATHAVFHSLGTTSSEPSGQKYYIESLPLKNLLDPEKRCLLALTLNGKPLSLDHGAPCRVVSPFDLGYKNAKYVKRIELSKAPRPGWWTLASPGYSIDAPVPPEMLRKK